MANSLFQQAIFFIFATLAVVAAAEEATLLVYKSIDNPIEHVYKGGNLTIRHNIFNVGQV